MYIYILSFHEIRGLLVDDIHFSVSTVSSTDPIVSTDGLGSSCDGTLSSFEEQPYRPAFAKNFGKNCTFFY